MASRFIGNAEVAAGAAPLGAVRRDATTAGAELGEQMGELMAKRAINFRGVVLPKARIERDQIPARIGPAGGAEKAGIPFHVDLAGELMGIEGLQDLTRSGLKRRITSQNHERSRGRKNKVELPK